MPRSGAGRLDPDEHGLLVPYLLRVVRIGVLATFLVLLPLGLYPFLDPQVAVAAPGLYGGAIVAGLLGAAGVLVLPWRRLLASRHPMAAFYAWSLGDIGLITLLVAATEGIHSPLWAVYALTTLFFAAAYPRSGQIAMLASTLAAYVAVVAFSSPPLADHLGELLVRGGLLATLVVMAGFISSELTHQMAGHARRARASRRVAEAGAHIARLEQDGVLEAVVDATADLGLSASAAVIHEGPDDRVVVARGLPHDLDPRRLLPSQLPPGRQAWVLEADEVERDEVVELLHGSGCSSLVVAPLLRGNDRVGVLLACSRGDPTTVEAVQTLVSLASNALENAELYRLKTDFVANVSHELRTPLTVLVGLGQTLSRRSERLAAEQVEDLASRVESNARRLEAMISTLLDFSRLQSPQRRGERTVVDVGELVAAAVERNSPTLSPRRVELDVNRPARALCDELMLEQVVDNLLANVAGHTPPTTTAEVAVRRDDHEVEVVVADDGPGIPAADAQRVTQRFFRGGDHLTRRSGGLGLGLALAQEILAEHGSGLEVSAGERGGTRVAFRLPAATIPEGHPGGS